MNDNNLVEEKIDNTDKKENLNMRVRQSLKDQIRTTMQNENRTADELFSDMYLAYLKEEASKQGTADYSSDIKELDCTVNRINTIFKNILEKTIMNNSIINENHNKMLAELNNELEKRYQKDIKKFEKELQQLTNRYDTIYGEYQNLKKDRLKLEEDSSKLEDSFNLLKHNNKINEELLLNYKEQIDGLKEYISNLEDKCNNSIDKNLLERAEIEKEKALLEKDKHYQNIISTMQEQYNQLQIEFTKSLQQKQHKSNSNNPVA